MRVELTEVTWLEEHVLSFAELAELSGLPRAVLEELIQAGAIAPVEHPSADQSVDRDAADEGAHRDRELEAHYGAAALAAARHARRLREDFELDASALLLVLGLCDRVSELEARLTELQARLPRRAR